MTWEEYPGYPGCPNLITWVLQIRNPFMDLTTNKYQKEDKGRGYRPKNSGRLSKVSDMLILTQKRPKVSDTLILTQKRPKVSDMPILTQKRSKVSDMLLLTQ